jgi:hypothetical protein
MSDWLKRQFEREGLSPWQQIAIFLVVFMLEMSRLQDPLFRLQFWAEDGRVFYANAYNLGWFPALFYTYAGYFHLVPRLAAALALLVPLFLAPLVMNIIALAAYALPVNILLSSRSAGWGDLRFRTLLAASYVAFPLSPEIRSHVSNAPWVLALSALLLIVGVPPRNNLERMGDVGLFLASGLSGPFCLFLLPISIFFAFYRHAPFRWSPVCILAFCSLVQASALLFISPGARSGVMGATPALFVRILAGNVFLDAIFGAKRFAIMPGTGGFLFLLFFAIAGSILSAAMFARARVEMKLFCLLAGMLFAASLISPSSSPPETSQWEILAEACGVRYWFLPALAFVWLLIDALHSRSRILKSISVPLLSVLCLCIVFQWRPPTFPDLHFADEVERFQASPSGKAVIIPENPDGWTVRLVKRDGGS